MIEPGRWTRAWQTGITQAKESCLLAHKCRLNSISNSSGSLRARQAAIPPALYPQDSIREDLPPAHMVPERRHRDSIRTVQAPLQR